MFDVITIGGATRDIYFKVKEARLIGDPGRPYGPKLVSFTYGAKILPTKTNFSYGGGGANTAIGLATLGLKVAACLNLGKEGTGDIVLENLKKSRVDTCFITRDPKLHTAVSFIIGTLEGDRIIFRYPGSDTNLAIKNWNEISKTKWFYITSLRGKSAKILNQIVKIVARKGVRFCFNPGESQLEKGFKNLKRVLEVTSVLILNQEEAMKLGGQIQKNSALYNINNLLRILKSVGPEIIVITCGKDGAYALSDDNKIQYSPIYLTKVVDATGAGDAFGSGFLAGLIYKNDIKFALNLGSANASSVISVLGAQNGFLTLKKAASKYNLRI